jgi:hypothetical protein
MQPLTHFRATCTFATTLLVRTTSNCATTELRFSRQLLHTISTRSDVTSWHSSKTQAQKLSRAGPTSVYQPTWFAASDVLTYNRLSSDPTFDIVVGTPPLAQHFTVEANVTTERSRFFREPYKPKWLTGDLPKVLVLPDEHPDLFQAYLNCVNRGPDVLKGCGDGVVREFQRREKSRPPPT